MLASVKQRISGILPTSTEQDTDGDNPSFENRSPIPDNIITTVANNTGEITPSRLTTRLNQVQAIAEAGVTNPTDDNPISQLIRTSGDKRSLERELHVDDTTIVAITLAERWQAIAETITTTDTDEDHQLDGEVTPADINAVRKAHTAYTKALGYEAEAELLAPIVIDTEYAEPDASSAASDNEPSDSAPLTDTTSEPEQEPPAAVDGAADQASDPTAHHENGTGGGEEDEFDSTFESAKPSSDTSSEATDGDDGEPDDALESLLSEASADTPEAEGEEESVAGPEESDTGTLEDQDESSGSNQSSPDASSESDQDAGEMGWLFSDDSDAPDDDTDS